jgi:spore coat protein U-like protein
MNSWLSRMLLAGVACAALLGARAASAQTIQVTATVARSCVISSTANIAFGSYDPVVANDANPVDQVGSVGVRCTRGTAYTVHLDQGRNAAGTTRQMQSAGGDVLRYVLYSDSGRTTEWADQGGTAASRAEILIPVFGRIPGGQDVPAGTYTDTLTASVNF